MRNVLIDIIGERFRNSRHDEVMQAVLTPGHEGRMSQHQAEGYRLSRYLGRLLRSDLPTAEVHKIIKDYAREKEHAC